MTTPGDYWMTADMLSHGGTLIVNTAGRSLQLIPQDNGKTAVNQLGVWPQRTTRIEVTLPTMSMIPCQLFEWAERAQSFKGGTAPLRRSSLLWYDSDSFYELLQAAKNTTVRHLIEEFEGCSGKKAAKLASEWSGFATALDRQSADKLLQQARSYCKPIRIERLGPVGADAFPDRLHYEHDHGRFEVKPKMGIITGTIPFLIELWMASLPDDQEKPRFLVHVNRTPIVEQILCHPSGRQFTIHGCGLHLTYPVDAGRYNFWLNIQTPYLPLSSNSKRPNLSAVNDCVRKAVQCAVQTVTKRRTPKKEPKQSIKAFITDNLESARNKASGNGQYRYSLRQLFYAIRPEYLKAFNNQEPNYDTFCQAVIAHETAKGADLAGIYRDNRGTLYHPHTGERIPLGTLAVEKYKRPEWTFNKILYCEKEGFFPLLIDTQWPERNDCALLTSKGYASKAARDVLDLMGRSDEPLTFFCIHDADGPGTAIYEALQQGTQARPSRTVTIVNLGLEPQEARAMGLAVETFERRKKRVNVASYVSNEDKEWLQTQRVELNAMDTPTFLGWLDGKLQQHHNGKVIPPVDVLIRRLQATLQNKLEETISKKLLEEAGFPDHVSRALQSIEPDIERRRIALPDHIATLLHKTPIEHWGQPVDRVAECLVQNYFSPKV